MINKWIGVGRLGKDPETIIAQSGTTVCKFSIATTEKWKGEESTEWTDCVAFSKLGEICSEFLSRGSLVYVEGRKETRSYEKDGVKRYSTSIVVREMRMLDGKKDGEQSRGPGPGESPMADENIPF